MTENVRNPLERPCDAAGRALRRTQGSLWDTPECSFNDAFILLDKKLNFVKMNDIARKLFERFVGDVMGKNILEVFPDIKKTERYYEYIRVIKTGEPFFEDDFVPFPEFGDVRLSVRAFKMRDGLGLVVSDLTERKRLETKFAETEAKYQALVDNSTDGIAISRGGQVIYANKAALEMFGFKTVEEIRKGSFVDMVVPEDMAFIQERIEKRLKGEPVEPKFEVRILRRDGEVRNVEIYTSEIVLNGEKFVQGIYRDITERRKIEEALRQSEYNFKVLFDSTIDCMFVLDAEIMKIVLANKAALDMAKKFGFDSLEEIYSLNLLDYILPEDRERVLVIIREDMFEKDLRQINEFRIAGKDGKEIWISAAGTRTEYQGRPVGLLSVRDITEQKKAEETLRHSEQRFRSVLDSSVDMIYRANIRSGTYDYVSPAVEKVIGYTPEELTALGLMGGRSLAHPDDLERLDQNVIDLVLHGGDGEVPSDIEYRFLHKKLGYRWMYDNRSIVLNGEREPVAVVGILRDITERKQVEDALRLSEERYRVVVENANEVIAVAQDGKLRFFNSRMVELLGYSREELASRPFIELVHPDDRHMVMTRYLKRIEGEEVPGVYPLRVVDKEGKTSWVEINTVAITWEGRPATLNFFSNITERKKAEEARQEAEENFKALAENAIYGILVGSGEGNHVYVNKRATEITGYSVGELLKTDIKDLAHPDELKKLMERYRRRLAGEPVTRQYETIIVRKDGKSMPVEIAGAKTFWKGKPADMVIVHDITERKKVEEALRDSEGKFRNVLNNSLDMIYSFNLKTAEYEYVSPSSGKILGYSPEELIEPGLEKTRALIHPDDLGMLYENTLELLSSKEGTASIIEYRVKHKELGYRWVSDSRSVVYDDRNVPLAMVGSLRDITEHKKAGDALRESERKFRSILENSVDVKYQVNLKTGKYDYLSPSAIKVLGYTPEEIVALTAKEAVSIVHPDDLAGVKEHFKKLAASAKPGDKAPAIEYRVKHKESGYRWVIDSSSLLFDEHSNPVAIVGTVHDITERKKAEDELWRTRERLQLMFDSVQDGVCVTDAEGCITDINPKGLEMYGASTKEELIGKSTFDLIVPAEQEKTIRELQMVLEQGATGLVEHNVMRADGSRYLAELNASTLKDISGNHTGFVTVLRDITERKKAEEALKESEERYRALVDTAGLAGEGIMIVERNAEGKAVVAFANEALAQMLGYKPEEMIGMLGRELFLPGDRVLLHEKDKRRRKGEKLPSHSGVMALRKDGSLLPIELSMGAMNLQGKTGTVVYIRDVSDRKAAEEALRQSETQFRAIFENAAMGVGIVDSRGHPLKINAAFEKMVGYTSEELRKTPFKAFMHPDDAFSDAKLFAEMLEGKRDQYAVEKRYIRKDGQTVWGRVTLSAVRDAKGKLSFAVGMVEDITESKTALEKLQRSEEHFRALIENAMDAIVIVRGDGSIGYGSPSIGRMLEYSPEEVVGPDAFRFAHPDDIPKVMDIFAEVTKDPGATVRTELRIQHKNGSWRIVEAVANNLLDNQAIAGIVVNWRDITERRKAEEERVRHTRRVEALYAIAQAVSQTLELEELLNTALGKTLEVMEADLGGIYLMDVPAKELVLRASKGLPERVVERISTMKLGTRKIQEIQKWAEGSLALEDVFTKNIRGYVSKAIEETRIKSYAVVPFFIRGQLHGLIAVGTRIKREFSAADMDLLKVMGNQIGIGTHNATLYEEVRALIRETLDAQEQERERVCLEVHDGVAQTLVAAFQYLQTLEASSPDDKNVKGLIAKATTQVKKAIQESREVINSLQPATLKDLGLVPTLRHELKRLEQETGLKVEFKADDMRLPKDVETSLYRIIREAVFNARKHSNTKRLRVRINSVDGLVKVEVKDWGKGFTQAHLDSAKKRGTGLFSIRKRTELMKGACDIKSAPGQGTTVYVEIPFTPAKEA